MNVLQVLHMIKLVTLACGSVKFLIVVSKLFQLMKLRSLAVP